MIRRATIIAGAICACAVGAAAQTTGAERSSAAALNHAISELRREAIDAKSASQLPRQEPDFARDFRRDGTVELPAELLWRKISRPIDRDPFVDAYIRWQLTGFSLAFPAAEDWSDEAFAEFLSHLPALLPNPRSDRAVIASVNAALTEQRISDDEAARLRALDERLRKGSAAMNNLNRPALAFREWIARQVGNAGHRIHLMRLERCAAMATAGWNVEDLKREIAESLEAAKRDSSFSREGRSLVAKRARDTIGLRTPILRRVGAFEGSPFAEFDEAAVYDFEVAAWVRLLAIDEQR